MPENQAQERQTESKAPAEEPRTTLAKERTRIASERTLMAWVRTAISLVGFGFAIPEFFAGLVASGRTHRPIGTGPANMGLFLIALGVLSLVAGAAQHGRLLRRTGGGRMWSLATVVALLVCIAGVYAFVEVIRVRVGIE